MASNYYCWHRLLQQQNPSRDATFLFEQVLSRLATNANMVQKNHTFATFLFQRCFTQERSNFCHNFEKAKDR